MRPPEKASTCTKWTVNWKVFSFTLRKNQKYGAEGGFDSLIPFSHFTEQFPKFGRFVRSRCFTYGPLS